MRETARKGGLFRLSANGMFFDYVHVDTVKKHYTIISMCLSG